MNLGKLLSNQLPKWNLFSQSKKMSLPGLIAMILVRSQLHWFLLWEPREVLHFIYLD
jgi:hypothetical protein